MRNRAASRMRAASSANFCTELSPAAPCMVRSAVVFMASPPVGSALLVRMEDVVLGLDGRVARDAAIDGAVGIGRELVGLRVVVEHRVAPAAALRKSLAVLFHDEVLREG